MASKWQQHSASMFGLNTPTSAKFAFFTLPCQKTDIMGNFVTRSHPCMCADSLSKICPCHVLEQFIVRTAHLRPASTSSDTGFDGNPISHAKAIEVFRRAIAATGASLTRAGPEGQAIHRFNEHVSMCAESPERRCSPGSASPWRPSS